jgi:ribosomal protein S18 acetylase RimI-like enzyme
VDCPGWIAFRPARADDAEAIAPLVDQAGGGVYEFLLGDASAGVDVLSALRRGIADSVGPHSHRQCTVAEVRGWPVAVAMAYPAAWMLNDDTGFLPPDRVAHLAAFQATQDFGSYFLSALAVDPAWRRRGLARCLIERTLARAAREGFDRLTLHVWADNEPARRLYESVGFATVAVAPIVWHPRLPHHGGSVLMGRSVSEP